MGHLHARGREEKLGREMCKTSYADRGVIERLLAREFDQVLPILRATNSAPAGFR
jgi:hypothetical protein